MKFEKIGDMRHDFFSDRFARVKKRKLFGMRRERTNLVRVAKHSFATRLCGSSQRTSAFLQILEMGYFHDLGKGKRLL